MSAGGRCITEHRWISETNGELARLEKMLEPSKWCVRGKKKRNQEYAKEFVA